MLLGIRVKPSNGEGHRSAGRVVCSPDFVEARCEFACCHNGITPKAPGKADVGVFAKDPDHRIAEVTGNPGTDADGKASFDELRGLLDMQLDKGLDRPGLKTWLSAPHGVDAGTAVGHVFGERAAGSDAHCPEG